MHLGLRNAATWRNHPRLTSKAYKSASALHAMAILQVHQAKALKQMHEGSSNPGLMQELRTATDFALRATEVPREGDVHHDGPGAPSLALKFLEFALS